MTYATERFSGKMTKAPVTPDDIRLVEERLADFQSALRAMRKQLEENEPPSVVMQFQTIPHLCDRFAQTIAKVNGYMEAALLAQRLRRKHKKQGLDS